MEYKVRFSKVAKIQLSEISDFIALDNPIRAVSFTKELLKKALEIGRAPYIYTRLISHPQFRKKTFKGYIILFTIDNNVVYIAHIINPVRDYSKLLK